MAQHDAFREAERKIEKAILSKATELDLSAEWEAREDARLTDLPDSLWQLRDLQKLNLARNRLRGIPNSIAKLRRLHSLNVSQNEIRVLSESFSHLTQLQVLDLSGNQLVEVPKFIANAKDLQILDLRSNYIPSLPSAFGQLRLLHSLYLSGNKFDSVPEWVENLVQLLRLELSHLALESLPDWFGEKLQRLRILDISSNHIDALPVTASRLSKLTSLDISDNRFDVLPDWIGDLAELETFQISSNKLQFLPESIGRLTALHTFYALNNGLVALPDAFGQLKKLRSVYLDENKLTRLPESIGALVRLKRLDLPDNALTSLPESLRDLKELEELYLHGNPGLGIPEDALGPEWDDVHLTGAKAKPANEILDYYFATRGAAGVSLREMKLIVVGWGKAGKTTLVKRLSGAPMDPTEPETHGIMIRPLTLECSDGKLKARVWDFGGQHVLHAMHEFFLTARSLYLLVVEQRGDRAEADAKYWLQLIRSYAPNAPVVVALNKSQGVERPIDKESLEKLYGPIMGWVATECLPEADCPGADASIAALRSVLTRAAESSTMPEPRKKFPKKWLAIKDWLEDLDEAGTNFVDYKTFSKKCAELGEPDAEKQGEVAALMHDLGVAMNYARDERLRDTTVLRPDWLANGIYAVLRANLFLPGRPLVPDAVLTADKLGEIYAVAAQKSVEMLKTKDYPPDKWDFLLRLMNLFQLSFPLNEDGSQQLCPTLLRADPPTDTDEPQGADIVRLRYEFAVVPAPLLPRFMVRMFSLIVQSKIWQRGAVLRYPGARARVWTTAEEKYLFATVAGPEGDRAELLSIIRATLAELFAEYRNLKVTEQRWFDGQWVPRKTLEKFNVLPPEPDGGVSSKEDGL